MATEFLVPDATCGHCKSTIEGAVSEVSGVRNARFELASKRLTVEHDDGVVVERLAEAVSAAGYAPEGAA